LEKNDYINGFQFFVDVASGWSTYAHTFRNYIMEECPKSSNIFVPVSALNMPITGKPVRPQYSYSNAIYCLAEWSTDSDCVLPINLHYSLEGAVRMRSSPYLNQEPRFDLNGAFESDQDASFFYASSALLNISRNYRGKKGAGLGGMRNYFEELGPMPSVNFFTAQYLVRLWDEPLTSKQISDYSDRNIYNMFYNTDSMVYDKSQYDDCVRDQFFSLLTIYQRLTMTQA
jgi:hypothetical protein